MGRLRRAAFLRLVKDNVRACKRIQRFWRYWVKNVLRPLQKFVREEKATKFIQQRLRGYQARRKLLLVKANFQAEQIADHYRRIDRIMKGRFQRRVRKAWFAYKEKKAEKARKKAEADAQKKAKRPTRRGGPTPAAPANKPLANTVSIQKPLKLERQSTVSEGSPTLMNTTGALDPRRNTVVLQADIMNITM